VFFDAELATTIMKYIVVSVRCHKAQSMLCSFRELMLLACWCGCTMGASICRSSVAMGGARVRKYFYKKYSSKGVAENTFHKFISTVSVPVAM
jgi:hypothetical protein